MLGAVLKSSIGRMHEARAGKVGNMIGEADVLGRKPRLSCRQKNEP